MALETTLILFKPDAIEKNLTGQVLARFQAEGFVIRGIKMLSLSDDLPVVIEMVDREDRILALLPHIEEMMGDGLATLEDVKVSLYRARPRAALDDEEAAPQA